MSDRYFYVRHFFRLSFILSEKFVIPNNESTLKYKKENHMLNQKLEEMEKMIEDYKHACYENDEANIIKNLSFDILDEANNLSKINKHARHYSDIYITIASIAYIFGSKSYNFLRKYFLFPHE